MKYVEWGQGEVTEDKGQIWDSSSWVGGKKINWKDVMGKTSLNFFFICILLW